MLCIDMTKDVEAVLRDYPRVYFACHTRHVEDPTTKQVLSAHQASILDHLNPTEPTSVRQLANHMGVTLPTMSLALDRLERLGFVARSRDQSDRRVVSIRLTDAGRRIKQSKTVLDPERVQAVLARLNKPERARALEGLHLLARAASEEVASRVSPSNPIHNRKAGGVS